MTDILIYVEDPGSANYLATIPGELRAKNFSVLFYSQAKAKELLKQMKIPFSELQSETSANLLLQQIAPKLILVGTAENPESFGLSLIEQGKKSGIPTIGAVDAFMYAQFRFSGKSRNALEYLPDFLIVPDESTKKEFLSLGVDESKINICGHPHYNYVLSRKKKYGSKQELRNRLFPKAKETQPIVMFVSEHIITVDPSSGLKSADYTLNGRGQTQDRTKIVLEEFLDTVEKEKKRPFIVLRLHPKDDPESYSSYKSEIDCLSQGGDPLEIVQAADLVVGLTTTLLLEAALLDIPTLSIVPRILEKSWLASVRSGNTPCVHDKASLRELLPRMIEKPNSIEVKSFLHSPLGSAELVVNMIEGILHE